MISSTHSFFLLPEFRSRTSRSANGKRTISPFLMEEKGYSISLLSISVRCHDSGSRHGRSSMASSLMKATLVSRLMRTRSSPGIWKAVLV
ncbi:hypothetical protein KC367_g75 [Hortaea werneckii]|nr:hypothetical protein KC367_g75 [Hortaea werneckii]